MTANDRMSIKSPYMRHTMVSEFRDLADRDLQLREWVNPAYKHSFSDHMYRSYSWSIEDNGYSSQHDDLSSGVGVFFYNQEEEDAVRDLSKKFEKVFKEIGFDKPDAAYLSSSLWSDVIQSAKKAYDILTGPNYLEPWEIRRQLKLSLEKISAGIEKDDESRLLLLELLLSPYRMDLLAPHADRQISFTLHDEEELRLAMELAKEIQQMESFSESFRDTSAELHKRIEENDEESKKSQAERDAAELLEQQREEKKERLSWYHNPIRKRINKLIWRWKMWRYGAEVKKHGPKGNIPK